MSDKSLAVRANSALPAQFSEEQVGLIKAQVMPGASHGELSLFMATCQRLQLDPFAKQIYAVKRGSRDENTGQWVEKWQTQTGIDGFRVVANRSSEYEGQVGPQWCGEDGEWKDVWLSETPPAASRVGVWRKGFREPTWGVARLMAYAQMKKNGEPTRMWKVMPDVMLAKCAEALALRKAFPNDLSGLYTREEMGQAENDAVDVVAEPVRIADPPVEGAKYVGEFGGRKVYDSSDLGPHAAVQVSPPPKEADFPVADAAPLLEFTVLQEIVNAAPGLSGDENKAARKLVYADILGVVEPGARWNPAHTFHKLNAEERVAVVEKAKYRVKRDDAPGWMFGEAGDPDASGAEKEVG